MIFRTKVVPFKPEEQLTPEQIEKIKVLCIISVFINVNILIIVIVTGMFKQF